MHIIGTAGHVDHGKSALVIALTGHNPDRFIEERERGMTLDLGFAPLRFDDGVEAGIIDVPGHERFLHNMLAGAAGMDLLLLVIAANEGPRPQTFDHLHILNFLNVRKAIVVLTKRDLVDDEQFDIARELTRDAVKGTVAVDAPMIAVSSVTGAGIDELKSAIHETLRSFPRHDDAAPAYLPVDRVFALPGHGTIVTGTLMQGTIRTGDELALQPSGVQVRVRSIQVFGAKREAATGGSRVAVNLPGVELGAIARGEALVSRREFVPTTDIQVDFTPLPSALRLLKRRNPVRAHIGSAEIAGTLTFDSQPPRETANVTALLHLQRPTVVFSGSRLILRRMSPKDLLGGAIVRSPVSAAGNVTRDGTATFASAGDVSDPLDERIYMLIESSGLKPQEAASIAAGANVLVAAAQQSLNRLASEGRICELARPAAYVTRTHADAAFQRLAGMLGEQRSRKPWLLGADASAIAKTLEIPEPLAVRLLHLWHGDGKVTQTGRLWHLPGDVPTLTQIQRTWLEQALRADPAQALLPYPYQDVRQRAATARVEGLVEALETLLATGGLVRVGDDLYRRAQIERARSLLVTQLERDGSATMAQLRDLFGTSRKYALPLMEYFDGIGVTMRDGDVRRLRRTKPVPQGVIGS